MAACCESCPSPADGVTARHRRVLTVVLLANAVMFAVESVWSLIAGSAALQADALDFLADTLTYGLTLAVLTRAPAVRARVALVKGASLGAMAAAVLGMAVWRALAAVPPDASAMGAVAVLALAVNLGSAGLLYRFRNGEANMASVWQCSRNDAIGNLAVIAAAFGVAASGRVWPDIAVAAAMAGLFLASCWNITQRAWRELEASGQPSGEAALQGRHQ